MTWTQNLRIELAMLLAVCYTGELARQPPSWVVTLRENWLALPPSYHSAQYQTYALAHPNIHPNCEVLEHVKGRVLQTQSYRTSMAQGNNRIAKRNPSESPVLMV